MKEWLASDLSGLDLLVIQIHGIHMDENLILVAAIGVDAAAVHHRWRQGSVQGIPPNLRSHRGDAWWQRLEQYLYDVLTQRRTEFTKRILKWADAGCPASNRALWRYIRHMTDGDRFNDMLVQVRAYVVRASPDGPYPQGGPPEFLRDIWITLVMQQVSAHTGVPATRSGGTASPSVAYFLSRFFERKGGIAMPRRSCRSRPTTYSSARRRSPSPSDLAALRSFRCVSEQPRRSSKMHRRPT